MHDGPLVTLSPLLLEDMLHLPLCVLYNGGLYADGFWGKFRVSANCVIARADFVNSVEGKDVAD